MRKKRVKILYICFIILLSFFVFLSPADIMAAVLTDSKDVLQDVATDSTKPVNNFYWPEEEIYSTDGFYRVNFVGSAYDLIGLTFERAAVKFDLSGITGTIVSASLEFYVVEVNENPFVNIIPTSDLTWNEFDSNTFFPTYNPTDALYEVYPITAANLNSWLSFDVTSDIQGRVDSGADKVAYVLTGREGEYNDDFAFVCNQDPDTTKHAKLVIEYVPAANAPVVTGTAFTNDTTPTWSWSSGGNGNGTYRYKLDDSDLSSMATETSETSYTSGPLSDGSYTLYVQESNGAGHWSSYGEYTITVDTVAPNAPNGATELITNISTPTWDWVSDGGGGNGTYRYKLDDSDLSTGATLTTSLSFTPASPLADGNHVLYVQERDEAGNWSVIKGFTFIIDTIPPAAPEVTGITPATTATPTWTWSSSGGGNGDYRYKLDDSNLTTGSITTSGTSYTPEIPLSEGEHVLYVQERDDAGNWSESGSFSIMIDTVRPDVELTSTATDFTNISPLPVTITFSEPVTGFTESSIVISNGTIMEGGFAGSGTTYTVSIEPEDQGVVTIDVPEDAAHDAAGNSNNAAVQLSKTYDTEPPTDGTISINDGAAHATDRTVTLTLSANDAEQMIISEDSTFSDTSYQPYTTSLSFELSNGDSEKPVYIKFKDAAGNETETISSTILLDTTIPTVTFSSSENNPTNNSPFLVTITFSENITGFTEDDITVVNGTISSLSGSGSVYMVEITPIADGEVTLDMAVGAVQDMFGNGNIAPLQFVITYDSQPPTAGTLSINDGATHTNNSTVTLTFSATDANYMIISENESFSGASYEAYDASKSFFLSAGGGSKTVYVRFKDEAGNESTVINGSIILDTDRPTIDIRTTGPNPTNSNSIPITITFSEPVTDFAIGKIVTTGDMSGFSGDGTVYTFLLNNNVAGQVDITYTLTIYENTVHDQAGNGNLSATYDIRYDNQPPTGGIVSINDNAVYTNSTEVTLSLFASDPIEVMISEDSSFAGASYEPYITNKSYTLSSGDGTKRVYIKYKDAAGNETYNIFDEIELDTSSPSVDILLNGAFEGKVLTNKSPIEFRIEFSEMVSGFAINDITVVNGTVADWSGDGQTYEVLITPLAQGTVTVSMNSGRVQDAANNNNSAAQPVSINYDSIRPAVTLFGLVPNPTSYSPIPITITFSEPVTGFTESDITVGNGTISNFSGSGAEFTVDVTPATEGEVSVSIPEGMVTDATGNTNTLSNLWVTTYVAPLTVTYYYNYDSEGEYTTQADIIYGSPITEPSIDPVRPGHRFEGWYKEADCINPWDFASDTITGDTGIYAKWVAKTQVSITEDIQEYTYDGMEKSFVISGIPDDNFTITYNQGPGNITPVNPGSYNVVISRAEDDTYAAYSNTITKGLVINTSPITIADIAGVTLPVRGNTPVTAITESVQYTGTVTWSPADASFAASTVYTATITLTPKLGYTLSGIPENFFSVAGASATNAADSGIITAVFPITGSSQPDGGGGSTAPTTPTTPGTPTYKADVNTDKGQASLLPVTVDNKTGRASVNLDSDDSLISDRKSVTINMPSVPGVGTYTLGIPVPSLSTTSNERSLTINSDAGSVNIPSNMLTGAKSLSNSAEAKGTKAEIAISQSDKKDLPKKVKEAIGDKPVVQLTLSIDGKQVDWDNPTAPVEVSIPYEPSKDELNNYENIVVWYIDGKGKVLSVPNGRYDPNTGAVRFFVTHFIDYAVAYVEKKLSDLNDVKWAEKAIEVLVAKGIAEETSDGIFSPKKKINRADYIVWLVRTLDLTAAFEDNFDDVKPNASYYDAVGIAKKLNILLDDGDGLFYPKDKISRQDMMVLTTRALIICQGLKLKKNSKALDIFKDKEDIADYAKYSMAILAKNGLTVSSNSKLKPKANATRAEAAALLYSIYNKYTNAPTVTISDTADVWPYPVTAPDNLKAASAGKNSIKLTWNPVTGATKYFIYQATSKDGAYKKLAETTSTSYTSKKLTTNKKYYYKVRAYRLIGIKKVFGAYTSAVSAKPVKP